MSGNSFYASSSFLDIANANRTAASPKNIISETKSPVRPRLSPSPVFSLSATDISTPLGVVSQIHPFKDAIKIPVNAPPAIRPELSNAPGPISDSLSSVF